MGQARRDGVRGGGGPRKVVADDEAALMASATDLC